MTKKQILLSIVADAKPKQQSDHLKMPCPKCGSKNGLHGDTWNYTSDVITCAICGLYHVVGAQKESLHRQITGHNPVIVDKRREMLK